MLAVELHSHSAVSEDGRDPVERLLASARRRNLDAIAVTDHDSVEASLRARDAATDELVVIPGAEVTSSDGHVLALGVEEPVPSGRPFGETVAAIGARDGTAVVPHPYQTFRRGVLANISEDEVTAADAIEVFNSRYLTGKTNRQARELAAEHGMPMTAGSDAHIAEMVGKGTTLVDAGEPTVEAILAAIREGRTEIDGTRTPVRVTLRQIGGTVKRHAKRPFTGGLR